MNIKKIASLFMCAVIAITLMPKAKAADYHFYGNQFYSDNVEDSIGLDLIQFYIESPLYDGNAGDIAGYIKDIAIDEDPQELIEDILINIGDGIWEKTFNKTYLIFDIGRLCYYSYHDFYTALSEYNQTYTKWYEQKIATYYSMSIKTILNFTRIVYEKAMAGEQISEEVLVQCQNHINTLLSDVTELRETAKMPEFKKYKKQLNIMADNLESMIYNTNLLAVYNEIIKYNQTVAYQNDYSNIYATSYIGGSGSMAVVAMAYNKLLGCKISESDVINVNYNKSSEVYWYTVEDALNLDDQVTRFYETNWATKLETIGRLAENAQSGIVIQINKTDYENMTRYILCVSSSDGDILVLDPKSGSSIAISLKQYCKNYNLDYNLTLDRIEIVWSYILES